MKEKGVLFMKHRVDIIGLFYVLIYYFAITIFSYFLYVFYYFYCSYSVRFLLV